MRALGDGVEALHEDAVVEGEKCLLLEVTDPALDLPQTLMRLVAWVERLPPKARKSWLRASIRRVDVGIQSGKQPRETQWIIPARTVAALVKVKADIALTVYGAEHRERGGKAGTRRRDGSPPGRHHQFGALTSWPGRHGNRE